MTLSKIQAKTLQTLHYIFTLLGTLKTSAKDLACHYLDRCQARDRGPRPAEPLVLQETLVRSGVARKRASFVGSGGGEERRRRPRPSVGPSVRRRIVLLFSVRCERINTADRRQREDGDMRSSRGEAV